MKVKAVMTIVGHFNITTENRTRQDGSLMSEDEVLETIKGQVLSQPGSFISLHHTGMRVEVTRG